MSGQSNIELLLLVTLVAAVAIMAVALGYYAPTKTASSGLAKVANAQNGKISTVCHELSTKWM